MTFKMENTYAFFSQFTTPNWSLLGNVFAFIGWLGVPVFVFLSGFGLQKKYSKGNIEARDYLHYNYMKLLALMLPATIFYLATFIVGRDWTSVISSVLSLSMLGNLWHFALHLNPTVYWYFGLTWELYLIYLLVRKCNVCKNNCRTLLIGGSICILLQFMLHSIAPENRVVLEWFRRNFIGWLPIFLMGIWMAERNVQYWLPSNKGVSLVLSILLLVGICFMNYNFFVWIFTPFAALAFFALLGKSIYGVPLLSNAFIWIGKYSSLIFVSQTIARGFARRLFENNSIILLVLCYLAMTILIALAYKIVYDKILKMIR